MIYVGSTINTLSNRLSCHVGHYKMFLSGKITKHTSVYDIFKEYGVENCKIELVEDYPCNSVNELRAREGYHIQLLPRVNKMVSGRTIQQYRIDKHEEIVLKNKKYRETHKEHYKEYRDNHKEQIASYLKVYYDQTKDKLAA